MNIRDRWEALGDDGSAPSADVAGMLDCSLAYVQYLRRQVALPARRRCRRCDFFEDEKRPIDQNGLCLWCSMEIAGENLRDFYENGDWQAAIDWRGDPTPGEELREALRERMHQCGHAKFEAAAQMGLDRRRLYDFLGGRINGVTVPTLTAFASYLGVPVAQAREMLEN